ncbi:Protein lysB [Burkholderia multivorans]
MSPLLIKLFAGSALVVALAGGVLYVRALHAENAALSGQLDGAQRGIRERDTTINGLKRNAVEKGRQQLQLDTSTARVDSAVSTIRQQIREAVIENANARAWADTPLPADVVRLSASPAYAGAEHFGAGMPAGDAVQPAAAVAAH